MLIEILSLIIYKINILNLDSNKMIEIVFI